MEKLIFSTYGIESINYSLNGMPDTSLFNTAATNVGRFAMAAVSTLLFIAFIASMNRRRLISGTCSS